MPYKFLDDVATADIAFEATGKTLNEVFLSAYRATLNVMLENLGSLEIKEARRLQLSDKEREMLLFNFLQECVYYKDAENLFLNAHDVSVKQEAGEYRLTAELKGEPVDYGKHHVSVDVKAITMHRFSLKETDGGWKATVVLDI